MASRKNRAVITGKAKLFWFIFFDAVLYIGDMKIVSHNLNEELSYYFWVQEFSRNAGQRWIIKPFLNTIAVETSFETNLNENVLELSGYGMLPTLQFKSDTLDSFLLKR